ncbi:FAD:protein FMN transferase [Dyella japonica]|uniref:FAD:protein FMN transferase n=1 Tax=Dyella japonica TaxID=231455 RepID=UPI00062D3851|nr:FAD:protein FMN transferase [Dyella japonica]
MPTPTVERARPLLGTTVVIRVEGEDDPAHVHAAISDAFAAIAHVHQTMSFHEPTSDLSRLHRAPVGTRVGVSEGTLAVLREALALADMTDGVFDVTVGAQLVRRGLLPTPKESCAPDASATWRDIELLDDGVRLHRSMWIDLGGIAKGYAVDQAAMALRAAGMAHACVDAGGDLRTIGQGPHRIAIDSGLPADHIAVIELGEAAVATSTGRAFDYQGAHLDGRTGLDCVRDQCASVVSARCIHADALTKVALALGEASAPFLRHYGATAHLQDGTGRWTVLGELPS